MRRSARFTIMLAVGALAPLAWNVADAQSVGDEELNMPSASLDIPQSVQLFGKRDPNLHKPTAIVNGELITETDVSQRLALVLLANGGKATDEEREQLRLQVLRNLIDETLQIQEARAKDIKVGKEELDQNFQRVAGNVRQSPAQFTKYLTDHGASAASIKRQIEGEVAWNRLLRRQVQPFINVSEDEVRAQMARMEADKGKDEYHIGEIYLSAAPETQTQVNANATQILEQIKKGGSFAAYARQYSEASTQSVGGDLGWVRLTQLPTELASVAQNMQIGQVAGPVPVPGGFSILYLMDKRQVLTADPRDALLSLKQLAINFPAGTTQDQAQKKAQQFGEITQSMKGCGAVADIAKTLGAEVVENDGIKARDLPPQLQSIMLSLQIGQSTPPFGSVEDGIRVLVLCGRDDPADASGPSFDQIMNQMEEDRINKRARTYLRDLRRDAVIDYN